MRFFVKFSVINCFVQIDYRHLMKFFHQKKIVEFEKIVEQHHTTIQLQIQFDCYFTFSHKKKVAYCFEFKNSILTNNIKIN